MAAQNIIILEQERLETCEAIIRNGLKTFVQVGEALLEIRNFRLYRREFKTFEEYCEKRWGMSVRQSQRLMNASEVVENLKRDQLGVLPTSEYQVRALAALSPEFQAKIWSDAVKTGQVVTGDLIKSLVDEAAQTPETSSKPSRFAYENLYQSGSNEWYTPAHIVQLSVKMLGGIDLDPCSNSKENPNVPAARHFVQADDGLSQNWSGKVFLNPPFGREIKEWVLKLHRHAQAGEVSEGLALLPSRTDTEWFAVLKTYPRCFLKGRICYNDFETAAPFPSVMFYMGKRLPEFQKHFGELGDIFVLA